LEAEKNTGQKNKTGQLVFHFSAPHFSALGGGV
jgi:hypothetical protein